MKNEEQFEQIEIGHEEHKAEPVKRKRRKIRRTVFFIGYGILMINATFFAQDNQATAIYGLCAAFAGLWIVDELIRYRASKQNAHLITILMGVAAGAVALAAILLR